MKCNEPKKPLDKFLMELKNLQNQIILLGCQHFELTILLQDVRLLYYGATLDLVYLIDKFIPLSLPLNLIFFFGNNFLGYSVLSELHRECVKYFQLNNLTEALNNFS